MAASRKLYVEVAKQLNDLYPPKKEEPSDFDLGVLSGLNAAYDSIARAFQRDNSNFDTQRFLQACKK